MTLSKLYSILVREPFSFGPELLWDTTLRWKLEILEEYQDKQPEPPVMTKEYVYNRMFELGMSLRPASRDRKVNEKQEADARRVAQAAADNFEKRQAAQQVKAT